MIFVANTTDTEIILSDTKKYQDKVSVPRLISQLNIVLVSHILEAKLLSPLHLVRVWHGARWSIGTVLTTKYVLYDLKTLFKLSNDNSTAYVGVIDHNSCETPFWFTCSLIWTQGQCTRIKNWFTEFRHSTTKSSVIFPRFTSDNTKMRKVIEQL